MDFKEIMNNRFSCRDFLDYEISDDELKQIISLAMRSASATNMQPAKLVLLKQTSLSNLSQVLLNAAVTNAEKSIDVSLYPEVWTNPYKTRRFETGVKLYEALEIKREDKEARIKQWHKNFEFFNAKNAAILYIDKGLANGALIDAGIFLANFLNALKHYGYDSCVLGSIAEYCDIIKSHLNIDGLILCGVAFGKTSEHKVNSFRTSRAKLSDIAIFKE